MAKVKGLEHLIAFMEANGGTVPRTAFSRGVNELVKQEYVKPVFYSLPSGRTPNPNFDYQLTGKHKGATK